MRFIWSMPRCRYKDKATRNRVVQALTLIREKKIQGTIQLSTESLEPFPSDDAPLWLEPVGRECDPKCLTYDDMIKAITAVLSVLVRLHAENLCHCDVRWPNVIFDIKGGGRFVLIDFEYARAVDEDLPSIKPKFIHKELQDIKKWKKFGDTHQVALMIKDWTEINKGSNVQIESILSKKWSAEDLLKKIQGMHSPTTVL